MSLVGIGGIMLIVTSICVISLSAETNHGIDVSSDQDNDADNRHVQMSIICALSAGLSFAVVSLYSKSIVQQYGVSLIQWNYDSNGIFGLMLLGPLIWLLSTGELVITFRDVALSIGTYLLSNTGALCSMQSIKLGKAGVVQGIENLKTVWLTIIISII